jgi:hypothetical protein
MISRSAAMPYLALAACVLTSACGGSDGGVASTPAPPAGPSYSNFVDLNKNVTLATTSTAITYQFDTLNGTSPGAETRDTKAGFGDGGITISYDAASKSYTLHDGVTAISYAPADKVPPNVGAAATPFDSYARNSNNYPLIGGVSDRVQTYRAGGANTQFPQLSYTTFVIAQHSAVYSASGISQVRTNEREIYAIGGFETARFDLPKSGTASYATFVTGSAISNRNGPQIVGGTATITADFAAGSLGTTMALTNNGQSIGTFDGTAPIEATTSHFAGNLNASGATQGSFSGSFFGPQGTEVGYTYRVQTSIGTVDGGVIGKK